MADQDRPEDTDSPIAGVDGSQPPPPEMEGSSQSEDGSSERGEGSSLGDTAEKAHDVQDAAGQVGQLGGSGSSAASTGLSSNIPDADGGASGALPGNPGGLDAGGIAGVPSDGGASAAGTSGATSAAGTGAAHGAVAQGGGGFVAGAMNAGSMAAFGSLQLARYIVKMFGNTGARISEATAGRISQGKAAGGTGLIAALLSMTVLGSVFGFGSGNFSDFDDSSDDASSCSSNVQTAADDAGLTGDGASTGDISAQKEATAKKIAAVLRKMGMTDIEIAGAFGNMEQESGIDPTSVQGFPTGTYTMTDAKKAAAIAHANGGGIGIIQWTPQNDALRAFAASQHKDWWDLDVQLEYMTSKSEWPGDIKDIIADHPSDLESAENSWLKHVEKAGDPDESNRIAQGKKWAAEIAGWNSSDFDMNYANSIVSQAESGSVNAGQDGVSAVLASCQSSVGTNANNSSLAQAAISYAWPFRQQSIDDISKGQDNRGTPLYQNVHYAIWGGNSYGTHPLASCDNGVTTAVQWSGSDSHIVEQGANDVMLYLRGAGVQSGTWKQIPWDNNMSTLQPGDILSSSHHILMYVGADAISKFYNGDKSKYEPNGVDVSASYDNRANATTPLEVDRSPGIGAMTGSTYSNHDPEGAYYLFRLVKPTGSAFQDFKPSSTAVDLQKHGTPAG